jgi:hypothetical protein
VVDELDEGNDNDEDETKVHRVSVLLRRAMNNDDQIIAHRLNLAMDTIELQLSIDGYQGIMVVIDTFTRFVQLYPIKDYSPVMANNLFNFITTFGSPKSILTDCGKQYYNQIMDELSIITGIDNKTTLPHSKQENSIVERSNNEIERHIRDILMHRKIVENWVPTVPLVTRIMNSSIHEAIGTTPAHLVFGNINQLDRGLLLPYDKEETKRVVYSSWVQEMFKKRLSLWH